MLNQKKLIKSPETYFYLNNLVNIPVNGEIPLHRDQEALKAYFEEEIIPNTLLFDSLEEKLTFMIENNYIDVAILNLYTQAKNNEYDNAFIKSLFKKIYAANFKFKSFMGAYKFYSQYALKTNDNLKYLERFEDRVAFNALYLGNGDKQLAMQLAEELISQRYQPATPTFLNAGKKKRGEMISCFLIDIGDSMLSIGRGVNSALQLSRIGGGVGVNLSNIRSAGDPIKGILNASSGVLPVMKLLEDSFSYSNQLGQRNGAGVVYLNVFHPDILGFLSTKKENADEKIRVKTLSLGLVVPDKYYELIKTNKPMYLFSPYSVEKEYGVPFSYVDLTAEYDNMVANSAIKKTQVNARELEQEISRLQQESGYPYILNIDTANKTNPVDGKIIMSNLCSEILQPQEPSKLNNDLSYEQTGTDISCNLGSSNIMNMMKSPDFAKSVNLAVRALTTVTDLSDVLEVPTVSKGNSFYHTIGLGAMGLHTALSLYEIEYGSKESFEFTEAYFIALNYHSLVASNEIAKEREEVFFKFEKSNYADGSYFETYLKSEFVIKNEKVKEIFSAIQLPTVADWENLKDAVIEYGLYHRNRLAVAPNGSISYINETSASLHPITQLIENRQEKTVGSIFYPAPFLSNKTLKYYNSAYDYDQRKIIDVYAVAQKHIDQGMSLTLFMRSKLPEGLYEWKAGASPKLTTRDLNRLRNYAWTKGIKSLYYIRTYTEDDEFIMANTCESCMI
ncbi:ribonucleoside-diphosphate reductase alpha chain [Carnobacterium iners]|uniref:Ribonucleoside-diphosphate reductase n=1 Tax=Carnobacterium iners TaxID=1073423 RepID=A0A1X7MVS3_9LACT|nr:class 1b ribonucleoside-diphosphate reductase subunit alpha [Carnobacterium iners]SEK56197.1 ribonucleoside-diphosphate reductase alpha chain [Carnobacterium iners]SMH28240.1 ribonucleoside-diphosphate reductase alpha chain [Carnobacterium iners]